MKFLHTSRRFGTQLRNKLSTSLPDSPAVLKEAIEHISEETPLLKTVAWVSAGVGAVAIGIVVGREIRLRYKFNRRTPYDLYAHSGDQQEFDFGLGI